jgi:hypothetical protein
MLTLPVSRSKVDYERIEQLRMMEPTTELGRGENAAFQTHGNRFFAKEPIKECAGSEVAETRQLLIVRHNAACIQRKIFQMMTAL